MKEIFLQSTKKAIKAKNNNIIYTPCPDQCVGMIEFDGNSWKEISINNYAECEKKEDENSNCYTRKNIEDLKEPLNNVIILVLESPHKCEFNKDGQPIGPANGKTGKNIRDYLHEYLRENFMPKESRTYDIVLVNAIQYQCSLGEHPGCFRNDIFSACWNNDEFKIDLINRLNKVIDLYKNIIIFNSCTSFLIKGTNENIKKSLDAIIGNLNCEFEGSFSTIHPCCWNSENSKRNRKAKRVSKHKVNSGQKG